jgi:hypothetical protein
MNIDKISGILKLNILSNDINKTIFIGAITLYIDRVRVFCTAFIPEFIINAEYMSFSDMDEKEIYNLNDKMEDKWQGIRINIYKKSEMWDYTIFKLEGIYKNKNIHFPKIKTLKPIYNLDLDLYLYGNIKKKIDDYKLIKKSNIIFYSTKDEDTYIGSIIHSFDEKRQNILGITGNLYGDKLIIIPLINFTKDEIKINFRYEDYLFNKSIYMENEYINNKKYPCLIEKYKNLEKNDIIIGINNELIIDSMIFNDIFKIYQPIQDYLLYYKELDFKIYRLKEIKNLKI